MLSQEENRLNLFCFRLLAHLNVIPLEFSKTDFRCGSTCRKTLWILFLCVQLCHILFSVWLMIRKTIEYGSECIPTLTVDYILIVPPGVAIFTAVQNFLVWPEMATALLSNLSPDPDLLIYQVRNGPLPMGYTYLELYTMLLACALYPAATVVIAIYACVYTLPLTTGLHFIPRLALVLLEGGLMLSWISWFHFMVVTQNTFMEKFCLVLSKQRYKVRTVEQNNAIVFETIRGAISAVKELQVETNAFNCSQCYAVFGSKLVQMGAVVFCGFAVIQFFYEDHVFGLGNILVVINASLGYTFCFERGFTVPRAIVRLRNFLELRLRSLQSVPTLQKN